MTIVLGRGNKRQTIPLPCGWIMANAAKHDPQDYAKGLDTICNILGVTPRGS